MKPGIYAYAHFLRDSASYKYIYKIKYSNNAVLVYHFSSWEWEHRDVYRNKFQIFWQKAKVSIYTH